MKKQTHRHKISKMKSANLKTVRFERDKKDKT